MDAFKVLTAIHGLVRAGSHSAHQSRLPIAPGEIVALPEALAASLFAALAIEPSDDVPTVELDWTDPANGPPGGNAADLVDPANWDAMVEAASRAGAALFKADDLHGIARAAHKLGAAVLHAGSDLAELAGRLSNSELVKELVTRLDSGHLPSWELPARLQPTPDTDQAAGADPAPGNPTPSDPAKVDGAAQAIAEQAKADRGGTTGGRAKNKAVTGKAAKGGAIDPASVQVLPKAS